MNRCMAYTCNNTKCRAKLKEGQLFCCQNHEPINREIIEEGCLICMEKKLYPNDIIYFKCKHAFHKECYIDWLQYSTYDTKICMICRNIVLKQQQRSSKPILSTNYDKWKMIKEILNNPFLTT